MPTSSMVRFETKILAKISLLLISINIINFLNSFIRFSLFKLERKHTISLDISLFIDSRSIVKYGCLTLPLRVGRDPFPC